MTLATEPPIAAPTTTRQTIAISNQNVNGFISPTRLFLCCFTNPVIVDLFEIPSSLNQDVSGLVDDV